MAGDGRSILPSVCELDVDVDIAGHVFEVRFQPASHWVMVLAQTRHPLRFVLEAVDDRASRAKLSDLVINQRVTPYDVDEAFNVILCEVSGRPWWEALNILDCAIGNWDSVVGGKMALARVDAMTVSFAVWLDAVWMIIREALGDGPEGRASIDRIVAKPTPAGVEPEMDVDLFNQALSETM